ncbi:hypothetical protein [Vaginella massiliensis]|uniref:hypothetical protein n=1 Tax=Vaginella massiliensis TaxID=1816680 RepID=UPI00083890F1|nr:hypothetical protein [Vaginella massiliensis]
MKRNPALVGFLVVLVTFGVLYIIYSTFLEKKMGYVIDNPSSEQLALDINGKEFVIAPNQTMRIDLMRGENRVKYVYRDRKIDTVINIKKANGLLNPTGETYYTFKRPYGMRNNVDSLFKSNHITIDDKVYFGSILKSDRLYIENFYYNLDEDLPKIFIKKGEKHTDLMKIFNEKDFKQFYFENYE